MIHTSLKHYTQILVKVVFCIAVVFFVYTPFVAIAQEAGPDPSVGGIVRCGKKINQETGALENPCGWRDLVLMAERLVRWLVFISVFVAAGTFTYAGFLYATSAGNEEQVKKAHEVFRNVLVGFLIVLAAWLIVYTISTAVVSNESILLLDTRAN